MKLSIFYFIEKLETYIDDTNVTDQNLLKLLSHLTDSIQAFVFNAKVIETNHRIESEIDKTILTCDNFYECRRCGEQTGKTYNSVVNHIKSVKHIAFVKHKKLGENPPPTSKAFVERSMLNAAPSMIPPFHPVNNLNQLGNQKNSHAPMQNAPHFPIVQPQLATNNRLVRPGEYPALGLTRPIVLMNNDLPLNANFIHPPIGNNNILPVNRFMNNLNQYSPDYLRNYKELFKMPSPEQVIGFQQNIVNPSNEFLRNDHQKQQSNEESDEQQSTHIQKRRRNRKKRTTKPKNSDNQSNATKPHDMEAISFLMGNFEIDVTQFIDAAREISTKNLYANITRNLKDCCKQMDLNVEVTCFGSRIIGVGTAKSDIDLNITVIG